MPFLRKTTLLPGVRNGSSEQELLGFQLQLLRDVVRERPDYPEAVLLCGNLLTTAHQHQKALASDRHGTAIDPANPVMWYNLACSLALTDRPTEALDTLEKAIDLGFSDAQLMAKDPDLDPIRNLPRFHALTARLG